MIPALSPWCDCHHHCFDAELKLSEKKSGQVVFVEVTYKKDWEKVRKVDAALRELIEQNTK